MKLVIYESVREVANGQDGARIINVVEKSPPSLHQIFIKRGEVYWTNILIFTSILT